MRPDRYFRRRLLVPWLRAGSAPLMVALTALTMLAGGCAGKPKQPATGPLRIKMLLVNSEGAAAPTANLHLLTVVRDAQG